MDLEARIARLEAIEACRSVFSEYTHYLDAGHIDDLMEIFSEDVEWVAANYPPGSGQDLPVNGRAGVRQVYAGLTFGSFRHHTTNVAVNILPSGEGELSSYFMTSVPKGLQGGLYQGSLRDEGDRWRIFRWRVVSAWSWRVAGEADQYFFSMRDRALRDGRPVVFRP